MIIESSYPISEEALKATNELMSEYDILSSIEVKYNYSKHKHYLTGDVVKLCRFCHKNYPEVKFKATAHAIPEFMGNKSLIAMFECSKCNQYFSQFESEFANFMLPLNALAATVNKDNKFTKYKSGVTIFCNDSNTVNITNISNDLTTSDRKLETSITIPTYIPDYIYRSLIKIGLSLIPQDKIDKYNETIEWLMDVNRPTIFPGAMILGIRPFARRLNSIRSMLFSLKKANDRQIPRTILSICYQNFSFQTFFPISESEKLSSLSPFPVIIPSVLDLDLNFAKDKLNEVIDLSGTQKVKGSQFNVLIEA